ncbi:hypothetical protein WDW37_09630 [Bdellovibrionota bacterium FG-1]
MTLRQNPGCRSECRVCHYKTLEYPEQLQKKQNWADRQLAPWLAVLRQIVPSPEGERVAYRAKSWMQTHFEKGQISFGMYRAVQVEGKWTQEFVSWNTCPMHLPAIQEMIPRLQSALSQIKDDFVERSLVGVWFGLPHLVVVAREPEMHGLERLNWAQILEPPFDRAWFHCNPQVGRKIFSHLEIRELYSRSSDQGKTTQGSHPIRAFRQIAQTLLREARAQAVEVLLGPAPSLVVDLYCGTGDLSLLLPASVNWLGIELSSEAIQFARSLKPPERAIHEAYVGTVEHRLRDPRVVSQIQGSYSLFLNPPRSGLSDEAQSQVLNLIREKKPRSIVYLSCSASSLARDLAALHAVGWKVDSLQPYDFFPQTEHFETLATLS